MARLKLAALRLRWLLYVSFAKFPIKARTCGVSLKGFHLRRPRKVK